MSSIFICTGALRALRCNQMEEFPMSIDGNLARHCAIHAHCTQVLVQQYKHFLFFKLTSLCFPPPFLFPSVFLCACVHMTSIWWIKSNALILSQTRPLLHVRSEMPYVRNCIPSHVYQGDGKQCSNRVLCADLRLPQNQQAVILPLHSSCVTIKIQHNRTK